MTSSGTGLSDYVCVTDLTTGSPGECSPTYS
jgi:UDP-glucose 4-epimerase